MNKIPIVTDGTNTSVVSVEDAMKAREPVINELLDFVRSNPTQVESTVLKVWKDLNAELREELEDARDTITHLVYKCNALRTEITLLKGKLLQREEGGVL